MTIIDKQLYVIDCVESLGYTNVRSNMTEPIYQSDIFPFIVVDIVQSNILDLSNASFNIQSHILSLSVFDRLLDLPKLTETRMSTVDTLNNIVSLLRLNVVDDKVQYVETILNGIKVCGSGCLIEVQND